MKKVLLGGLILCGGFLCFREEAAAADISFLNSKVPLLKSLSEPLILTQIRKTSGLLITPFDFKISAICLGDVPCGISTVTGAPSWFK